MSHSPRQLPMQICVCMCVCVCVCVQVSRQVVEITPKRVCIMPLMPPATSNVSGLLDLTHTNVLAQLQVGAARAALQQAYHFAAEQHCIALIP